MEKVKVISVKPITIANEKSCAQFQGAVNSKYSPGSKSNCSSKNNSKKLPFSTKETPFVNGDGKSVDFKNYKVNGYSRKPSRSHRDYEDHTLHIERNRALSIGNYNSGLSTASSHFQPDFRASFNERIITGPSSLQQVSGHKEKRKDIGKDCLFVKSSGLHRSNSSLELDHDYIAEEPVATSQLGNFKREYGSHGSINVSPNQDTIYSILQSYQSLKQTDSDQVSELSSQKGRSKIHKLWDKEKSSIFKKLLPSKANEPKSELKSEHVSEFKNNTFKGAIISNSNAKQVELTGFDNKSEDTQFSCGMKAPRRSYLAHYDCQSLAAQLSATRIKTLLADRTNTTTGASAAAMAESDRSFSSNSGEVSSDDSNSENKFNHLVSRFEIIVVVTQVIYFFSE